MIVISSSLFLSESTLTADHPIIGFRNIVTTSNIAATASDDDYAVTNLANPATHLRWQGESDSSPPAAMYLTITTGSADPIDYVGIAKHNFGTAEIAVSVEGDDGGGYDTLAGPVMPGDDSPLLFRFSPASFTAIRVKLDPGSDHPRAAVLYCGKLLVLPRLLWQGHVPINYGRRQTVINGKSESGNFLGRIITGEWRETRQNIILVTPTYYREDIDEFLASGKDTPFFWGWRPATYPAEVGYCWITNDPEPLNSQGHGLTEFNLQMTGIA